MDENIQKNSFTHKNKKSVKFNVPKSTHYKSNAIMFKKKKYIQSEGSVRDKKNSNKKSPPQNSSIVRIYVIKKFYLLLKFLILFKNFNLDFRFFTLKCLKF